MPGVEMAFVFDLKAQRRERRLETRADALDPFAVHLANRQSCSTGP